MYIAVDASSTLDTHCILRIVDGIYAAACGEATWDQTLAQVCQFGGLDGAALSALDALEGRCVLLASCGLRSGTRPDANQGTVTGESLLVDSILRSTSGTVLHGRDVLSDAVPGAASGMRVECHLSSACVVLGRDERRVFCLEVHGGAARTSDCPDPGEFLRQLAPHLVRAWRIGRASRAALATPGPAAPAPRFHGDIAPAADLAGLPEAARLRAEFGLTKAEARLALRLAEGSSLASAAQAFDVKLTTIRSQLQQVFGKTGTSRQSELVAMLLSRGYGARRHPWMPERQAEPALAAW